MTITLGVSNYYGVREFFVFLFRAKKNLEFGILNLEFGIWNLEF